MSLNRQQRRHLGPEPKTSDVSAIESHLTHAIATVSEYLYDLDTPQEVLDQLIVIQTHCAVSLRLMAKTPPSLIKSEAVTFEIKQRLAGKPEMAT